MRWPRAETNTSSAQEIFPLPATGSRPSLGQGGAGGPGEDCARAASLLPLLPLVSRRAENGQETPKASPEKEEGRSQLIIGFAAG